MDTHSDNITLTLDGTITIQDFAEATQALNGLVSNLSQEVNHSQSHHLAWQVEQLEVSGAIITLHPLGGCSSKSHRVVREYESIGQKLSEGKELKEYSAGIVKAAQKLVKLVQTQKVTSIRFETAKSDYVINPEKLSQEERDRTTTFGAVEGRMQMLSNRHGLRFFVYDFVFDKAVSCYIRPEQQNLLLNLWGKEVIVEGSITRDHRSGRPMSVRNIVTIEVLNQAFLGAYKDIIGAYTLGEEISSEEYIRRLRDDN